jgi:hypothetical protein
MCVSLPQITSQLRGRHWLHPGGLATVICQVPAPCRAAAGSYSQLTWFWLLRHAFLRLCYVNVDVLPALDGRRPSLRCFFAPADCSRWKLRLHLPPELVEETSPWQPVDVAVTGMEWPFFSLFTFSSLWLHFGDSLGHSEGWGGGLGD